jgi:hypothetical protein
MLVEVVEAELVILQEVLLRLAVQEDLVVVEMEVQQ